MEASLVWARRPLCSSVFSVCTSRTCNQRDMPLPSPSTRHPEPPSDCLYCSARGRTLVTVQTVLQPQAWRGLALWSCSLLLPPENSNFCSIWNLWASTVTQRVVWPLDSVHEHCRPHAPTTALSCQQACHGVFALGWSGYLVPPLKGASLRRGHLAGSRTQGATQTLRAHPVASPHSTFIHLLVALRELCLVMACACRRTRLCMGCPQYR